MSDGTGCDNMTCIIVKLKPQLKRPHYDVEEDDAAEDIESKKPKSDSTWLELWSYKCNLLIMRTLKTFELFVFVSEITDTYDWYMDIIFY